jgi:hypothetical protein
MTPRTQLGVIAPALLLALVGSCVFAAPAAPAPAPPIRAAFYYPWYPQNWTQNGVEPFSNYRPTRGFYTTTQSVVQAQISDMLYGNISAGIASWWGQGSPTDARIPMLLQSAAGTAFRWALYYEPEGYGDPSVAQITSDLTYIASHYANSSQCLHVNGKPVLFVYSDAFDGCSMATRWLQANAASQFYVDLRVFPGYQNCTSQPDSWHQYDPILAIDYQAGYSTTISPGFWKYGTSVALSRETATTWSWLASMMIASGTPWQLVTTYNEWGEGTAVESSSTWASSSGHGMYIDALHNVPLTYNG